MAAIGTVVINEIWVLIFYFGTKSSPTKTRSLFDMSPIGFLTGKGSFLTRVGKANIFSFLVYSGF